MQTSSLFRYMTLMSVTLLAVVAMELANSSTVNAQQWTGPDANNNITNANTSGNVGIGTAPVTNLTVAGAGVSFTPNTQKVTAAFVQDLTNYRGIYLGHDTAGQIGIIAGGTPNLATRSSIAFWTTNGSAWTENMRVSSSGVGIGTTNPNYALDVVANAQWVARFKKTDATHGGILVDAASGYNPNVALGVNGTVKWYMNNNVANGDTLQFWESAGSYPRFTLTQAGNVGVGNTSPGVLMDLKGNNVNYGGQLRIAASDYAQITFYDSSNLTPNSTNRKSYIYHDVVGGNFNIASTGNIVLTPASVVSVTGSINVSGNINAKYQDVAEWVPTSEKLATGTVVVLDSTKSNQVIASTSSYDTRVAGVISEQPGIALGEKSDNKVLVATTGRVRVKVDASKSPINIGDLLVTSDVPGSAMKSEPVNLGGVQLHRPGTLIGKALEPLAKGSGEILVLLSLQ